METQAEDYFDIDFGEPNPVVIPNGWVEMLGLPALNHLAKRSCTKQPFELHMASDTRGQ